MKRAQRVLLFVSVLLPLFLSRVWHTAPAWLTVFGSGALAFLVASLLRLPGRTLTSLAAVAAGFLTWIFGYGLVVFDNPSAQPLVFEVDGAAQIPLDAWQHEQRYFPVGEHHFQAAGMAFDGHVDSVGKHLATPYPAACYALFETVYGSLSGADTHGDERLSGKSFYTLKYVSYFFKDPPRTESTSGCESGRAERKLDRSRCE